VLASLVILGCSRRKRRTSRLGPAIDRYDGPVFRVLRKHAREALDSPAHACILSGRFGLIRGDFSIPRYERQLQRADHVALRRQVEGQLNRILDELQPERLFVSVGCRYWPLLEKPLARAVSPARVVIATGGIGGRASHLAHWLRADEQAATKPISSPTRGVAVLLGTTVRLTRDEVLQRARDALLAAPVAAQRFETWCVPLGSQRVAPKWLVSVLFDKPVARFRTADARRVLSLLGVDCTYASRHKRSDL
jgi:hypothetical protein